jgi:hypothetical protein
MHPSTLLVALTIGFSQVTVDVFAHDSDPVNHLLFLSFLQQPLGAELN